jgi:hypothetical protein
MPCSRTDAICAVATEVQSEPWIDPLATVKPGLWGWMAGSWLRNPEAQKQG